MKEYLSRRMLGILFLGFSSGLPLGLTGSSLQAWMTDEKVDLTVIGFFSLVGLPYTVKFLWAPFLDAISAPFFFARFGRRRGWIALFQLLLMGNVFLLSLCNPVETPAFVAFLALSIAFFSASQDIVVDALRAEVLPAEQLGMGTGVNIMGYRIAMLVSGALALILADIMPWGSVYALLACMFLLGVAGTVLIEEKEIHFRNEQEPFLDRIRTAVIGPFQDFFKRKGAFEILLFLTVYKLGDVVASAMTTPFFLQTGFTKTDVGAVYKVFGMIATVVGGLWGGALLARLGIRKSLFIFGILQAATNLMFAVLAQAGPRYELLVTTVMLENLAGGMGTAAYSAFMMTLCRAQFTASQYALLSSLMAVARVFIGAPTGFMAKNLGWSEYYLATVVFAIPGLLMLVRYPRWENR